MSVAGAALLRACSLLLCLVAGSLQLSIKEFAVPNAIENGEDAELRCQYELGPEETETALYVKWWRKPASSANDDRKLIYQRIAGLKAEPVHNDKSSVIEIKENDTIVLTNVTPVDSGTYECEVSNIEEKRQHGSLVVFKTGDGPLLNISEVIEKEEDGSQKGWLFIECQVEEVAPKPVLGVTINGQNVNTTTEEIYDGLYWTVNVNATLSTDDMEKSDVTCEMHYLDKIPDRQIVATTTFVPAGCDTQSTTEMPEDTREPDATPGSLQNSKDDGVRLHSSWILLTSAVILTHLKCIL